MKMKQLLWVAPALIGIAIGFVLAQQYERGRSETRIRTLQTQQDQALTTVRREANVQMDAIARTQGETVLQAFAAGIGPAVVAGRRESVELAAVSMLHLAGVAGIHVLALDGSVIYSSDAKLTATGEGDYRGKWALGVSELTSRPSTRPNVVDIAVPVANAGTPQAIAWLEYDIAAVKNAASASSAQVPSETAAQSDASLPSRDMPATTN